MKKFLLLSTLIASTAMTGTANAANDCEAAAHLLPLEYNNWQSPRLVEVALYNYQANSGSQYFQIPGITVPYDAFVTPAQRAIVRSFIRFQACVRQVPRCTSVTILSGTGDVFGAAERLTCLTSFGGGGGGNLLDHVGGDLNDHIQ